MPEVEKDENLDYSLTLNALYTALYSKENPYVESKESAFVLSEKPSTTFRNRLLKKAEDKKNPLFATPSDYSKILSTFYSGKRRKTASSNSGSHRTFLVTHLGGWRSGKTNLANATDPIFHDNERSAGSVRGEFCEELLSWEYSRDEKGSCRFFKKRESMENPLSAGSRPLSEYIVECNYTLISKFYVRKAVLRQVIVDFASNMEKAEEKRRDNGQNDLISDPENKEGVKELCDCLNKIMDAYDQLPETEPQREWLISRALTWLVIAAFLREYLTPYVIEQCMKGYLFNTYQPGTAEDVTEQKEKKAGKAAAVSVPELFWCAGKSWYDEARKPGARFHSLDIVDHILPDASDKPVQSGSEHGFPFRATDKEEHTIQCSRFSELLQDRNSIYHQGHFMLIGEGGIGKTTTLMSAMYDSYEGKECYRGEPVIPLFVELSLAPDSQESAAYGGTSSSVIYRLIYAMLQKKDSKKDFSDLLRKCMNEEGSIAKDTIREYFSSAEGNVRYVLLVDGLNEVSAEPFSGGRSSSAQGRILQEITEMVREYHNVTIVLTGRASAFINAPSFHLFHMLPLAWDEVEKYLCKKGKSKEEISDLRNGDKGLIDVLSVPMFLTMYALLKDTKGVTTRAELMKVFFHERVERRNKEYVLHRQGDISERIDYDEEQSVSGNMKRGRITLLMQWLFLDILIPEIAAKMVGSQIFRISKKEVRLLLQSLFTNQDSLYCGKYKDYSNSCFEEQMQGEYLEDIIADFTYAYSQKSARYSAAFLRYCELSMGILFKEGENTYGFIHQHFRDYFAAVCNVNRMRTAYTAYLEDGSSPAREIMQKYDREPLNPVLMVFIGEYLGEHHNISNHSEDTGKLRTCDIAKESLLERQLISTLLNIYRDADQTNHYGVYNLIDIIKRTRNDLSGMDFHGLDLRKCRFFNIPFNHKAGISFANSVINADSWFVEGHSSGVNSASFSRDGNFVVTASWDNTTRIWDTHSGALLHTLEGHSSGVNSASFSRDGSLVVTASRDCTARIWDTHSGVLLHTLEGHSSGVYSASFSRDGSFVVTASGDNTARIWDTHSGALLYSLEGHSQEVRSAVFSRDGSLVVTASWDDTIRIWDTRSGVLLHTLEANSIAMNSAEFSSDGSLIVAASMDNTARIWDTRFGVLLHTFEGHSQEVRSASFSRDGSLVVTASGDCTVRIWDTYSGMLLHTLEGHASDARSLAFSSFSRDGKLVITATGDNTVCIWNACSGVLLHTLKGHASKVNSANFSRDGSFVVTASRDRTARIWDTRSGMLLYTLEGHTSGVNSADFSRDGSFVITASKDRTACIWDTRSGMLVNALDGHNSEVFFAAFNRDGSRVVTASWDNTVRIWDTHSGVLLHCSEVNYMLNSCVYSPFSGDGNLVVTASDDDNTACICDTHSGVLLHTLKGHSSEVVSAAFSRDERLVVTASIDHTARIWDTRSGMLLHTLEGHFGEVFSAAFSKDGSLVVTTSSDHTARIWDTHSGVLLHTLEGHFGEVLSAVFSRDGSLVVTDSEDKTVRIWDVKTGKEIRILYEVTGLHINGVNFKDISPQSKITDRQKEIFRQYGAIV